MRSDPLVSHRCQEFQTGRQQSGTPTRPNALSLEQIATRDGSPMHPSHGSRASTSPTGRRPPPTAASRNASHRWVGRNFTPIAAADPASKKSPPELYRRQAC